MQHGTGKKRPAAFACLLAATAGSPGKPRKIDHTGKQPRFGTQSAQEGSRYFCVRIRAYMT
jgi:hypothetical protein